MFERHSSVAQSAYIDLLRSLQDDAVLDLRGSATKITRNGKVYWYDSYRVGQDIKKRYLGEDTPELRSRLERQRALKETTEERKKTRTRLIRLLRAENFLGLDGATGSLLNALAGAGVFRLGGTLVGTQAFRLYEGELGVRFPLDMMAHTDDIDIASFSRLSLALEDSTEPGLPEVFRDLSFDPRPSLDPGRTWRWRQSKADTLVEFLTPSFDDVEGLQDLPALGVSVQGLHHLNYLIAEPIRAAIVYRSGVLVQIPRPERYAIHKLIIADRRAERNERLKSEKDRNQAAFLIEILAEDRPDELQDAFEEAISKGPKWRQRISTSLQKMPETKACLDHL